jgi:hypothetical protein
VLLIDIEEFWYVIPCRMLETVFYLEDEGSRFLENNGKFTADCTASCARTR